MVRLIVAVPIADQLLDEGFVSTTIDLTGVFTDPESDVLTYSAVSSNLDCCDMFQCYRYNINNNRGWTRYSGDYRYGQ
jgi:hypothetical protein